MCEPTNHLHGRMGVFYGGDWVPMAEAEAVWNNDVEEVVATCKESERCAALGPDEYDVVIVGAGCIGCSVARELSKFALKVLVLEAADDVTQGATKGNSGIVHAGYDDAPGSVRARFCPAGNRMFPQLDKDLKFGFQRNGSLVVARSAANPGDDAILLELLARGKLNGVEGLRILDQAELRRVEPAIAPDCTGALFAPSAGVVIPFEFTIALAENAASNGVEFRCRCPVVGITRGGSAAAPVYTIEAERWFAPAPQAPEKGMAARLASPGGALAVLGALGAASAAAWPLLRGGDSLGGESEPFAAAVVFALVLGVGAMALLNRFAPAPAASSGAAAKGKLPAKEVVTARFVVNAAGLHSDKVAAMLGDDSFKIKPRIGEYLLLKRPDNTAKEQPPLCRHIVFPCPGKMGKGILVQPTLWGNLCLGPTAHDFADCDHRTAAFDAEARGESKEAILSEIEGKCRELIPSFDLKDVIHSFAGVRAKNSTGDWVVRPVAGLPSAVHAAGIDSPGLAGSPAIAVEVVRLLGAAGLPMAKNPHFNPKRKPYIVPKGNWKRCVGGAEVAMKKDHPSDPALNVVCRCELVTEAEVADAVRRGRAAGAPVVVENTQQVRKRCRAGMGWCQGQYCTPKVQAIIARELGRGEGPAAAASVEGRPWPASSLLASQHQYADNK